MTERIHPPLFIDKVAYSGRMADAIHDAKCPYKPTWENDIGNEYAMVILLKSKLQLAEQALMYTLDNIDDEQRKEIVEEAIRKLRE